MSTDGILFSLKKEGNSDTHTMNEPWGHHAKWNKPIRKRQALHNSIDMRSLEYPSSQRK